MFDKTKLENGMVVVFQKNGGIYIVINDKVINNDGYVFIENIQKHGDWSINKVYDKDTILDFSDLNDDYLNRRSNHLIYSDFESNPLEEDTLVALTFTDEYSIKIREPKTEFFKVRDNELVNLLDNQSWKTYSECSINNIADHYMIERVRVFNKDNELIYDTKE
jgi:hypothetical protein